MRRIRYIKRQCLINHLKLVRKSVSVCIGQSRIKAESKLIAVSYRVKISVLASGISTITIKLIVIIDAVIITIRSIQAGSCYIFLTISQTVVIIIFVIIRNAVTI